MSVRKKKWKTKDGKVREEWMVHVERKNADDTPGKPIRKVLAGMSKREAEAWERRVLAELVAGTYGKKEVEVPTLEKFSEEYVSSYATSNNKPSTVAAKRQVLRTHLLPTFGHRRLNDIGARDIEAFKGQMLKAEKTPKTVNNCLTVLRKMLAVAVEWKLIDHVPPVKWLKVPKPEFDFLDFDEAERLLGAADIEWWSMMMVALRTGLRQGELRALRWDDVDLTAGRLVVRRSIWKGTFGTPKNGRTREVPLSRDAVEAFKRARHLKGELVFSKPDGSPLTKEQCKHPLWRGGRKAGLRRIGWHVLRHTFASHLAMRGRSMKEIQELMGHSTMEMTMRYAHLSPQTRRDAVSVLDLPAPAKPDEAVN